MSYVYNLPQLFREVVSRNPEAPALLFSPDEVVTYARLERMADRFARGLLQRGVRPRDVVCIGGRKTPATYAALLACLKIGAPYVFLDPESPVSRLQKIVERCKPALLLPAGEDDAVAGLAGCVDRPLLQLQQLERESAELPDTPVDSSHIVGNTPAYVMFTSGSTGFPKGAVMTHANVLNLVDWSVETYGFGPGERLTNVNPIYFDNSVFDIYSSLFSGAALVPFTREETLSPGDLVRKIDTLQCSSWFSVPSMLIYLQTIRAFSTKTFRSVRRFIFGGEGYPLAKLKLLFDTYPEAEFHNVYGPTECTCICSTYRLSADDFVNLKGYPPLGRLIPNFDFLVLDDQGRPAPQGEVGELCLLGPQVGLGYYNDPERTRAAFCTNPCNSDYREPMYRTGDLVRVAPEDGTIWILGRTDNQVKRMGYRIELEEIENALCCLPGVARAAVVFLPAEDRAGRIMAAVQGSCLECNHVLNALGQVIPDYMLPDMVEVMESLPMNQNGKIDRPAVLRHFKTR